MKKDIEIGDTYMTGDLFWVSEKDFLEMSGRFLHGHDQNSPGKIDKNSIVKVRKSLGDDNYVAELIDIESGTPYGSQSAIGTLFIIKGEKILSWKGELESIKQAKQKKQKLIKELKI